jgi:hypothetical protein
VAAGVFISIYTGYDINFRAEYQGTAIIVSLIGLIVMFTPIIYFQNKLPNLNFERVKYYASQLSIEKTFRVYLVAFLILNFLAPIRFILAGYTQIIVSLIIVKWFLFLLFGFQCLLKKKRRKIFYFFIAFEFVSGLGFFSDFKTVLFFVAYLYIFLLFRISLRNVMIWIIIGLVGFFGSILWTTVKNEYRQFLTQGKRSQNVEVSKNDALSKLYELSSSKNERASSNATVRFLDRLQGTFHLALSMRNVPMVIPYQNGNNWAQTFEFVLTPRLLNPNKPVLDQSVKASKYTGIQYAGLREGTAVSLGYFADCYIDFGVYGMMVVLLLLGITYGYTYFWFMKNSSTNYIFNCSVVGAILMEFFPFDMDITYFLGRFLSNVFIFFILKYTFFPWLSRYLYEPAVEKA